MKATLMSRTEWVYTYDDKGNRTGLVEQEIVADAPPSPVQGQWYSDIENEIERRAVASSYRYHITPMESAILTAERKVLTRKPRRGVNMTTYERIIEQWYTEPDGTTGVARVKVQEQDTDVIAEQIQKLVGSYGVSSMTKDDIYDVLNVVSACYESADIRGTDKPLITFKVPNRLRKAG